MMPREEDVAHCCPVVVDAQKSEGQGDLGHPRASPLNQEVDESQRGSSEQGEYHLVFSAGERQ